MRTTGLATLAAVILAAMLLACDPADPATVGTAMAERSPERDALVALYHAANGESWTVNDNWLTDAPLGTWYGVGVDGEERVLSLDLSDNQLTGEIPQELGQLVHLEQLILHDNRLTGNIPHELGRLIGMKVLVLAINQLTGEIPAELGNLVALIELELRDNGLDRRDTGGAGPTRELGMAGA